MKKIIIILLVAVMLLSSCGTEIEINEVLQTNEGLSIHIGYSDAQLQLAADIFRSKYPEIPLEVTTLMDYNADENSALVASLMAGNGPDLLCTGSLLNAMGGIEKQANNGVFADMSEFYDADTTLSPSLNQTIMDAGVFDGKRYLFPLKYNLSLGVSSQETMDKYGFNLDNCVDYSTFLTECEKALDRNNGMILYCAISADGAILRAGINPIDLENATINLDIPEVKQTMEFAKKLRSGISSEDYELRTSGLPGELIDVYNGDLLFYFYDPYLLSTDYLTYSIYGKTLMAAGQSPVLIPVRNKGGGVSADVDTAAFVRANSANKENAYKFIQILLSEEVQFHRSSFINGGPVLNNAYEVFYEETRTNLTTYPDGFPMEHIDAPRELFDEYISYIDEISYVNFDNYQSWVRTFFRSMLPYLNGEINYEECLAETKESIEFSLSE